MRVEKVEKELLHQVGRIVEHELNDPGIGFITITGAKITPDLREAVIYFTMMDAEKGLDETAKVLERASGFVRKLIGERMRMKFTPHIGFVYDDSRQTYDRIDEIIDVIRKEKGEQDEGKSTGKDN